MNEATTPTPPAFADADGLLLILDDAPCAWYALAEAGAACDEARIRQSAGHTFALRPCTRGEAARLIEVDVADLA